MSLHGPRHRVAAIGLVALGLVPGEAPERIPAGLPATDVVQERPFRRLDDGRYAIRASGSGSILIGPLPEALAGRGMLVTIGDLQGLVADGYPPALLERGAEGSLTVGLLVDWSGAVLDLRIDEGSGEDAFDFAALRIAAALGFTQVPTGAPLTRTWIAVPITFEAP
jgi:TonB family protein